MVSGLHHWIFISFLHPCFQSNHYEGGGKGTISYFSFTYCLKMPKARQRKIWKCKRQAKRFGYPLIGIRPNLHKEISLKAAAGANFWVLYTDKMRFALPKRSQTTAQRSQLLFFPPTLIHFNSSKMLLNSLLFHGHPPHPTGFFGDGP